MYLPPTATYDNRLTALNAFQRDVFIVIAHGDPQHGLGIKDDLKEEMDIKISRGRLSPHLDELVEWGLVGKDSVDERANRYELTEQGRHTLRRCHNWVYSALHLRGSTLDEKRPTTHLRSTVARGRSRSIATHSHRDA